jgi:hypothetical protein
MSNGGSVAVHSSVVCCVVKVMFVHMYVVQFPRAMCSSVSIAAVLDCLGAVVSARYW